MDLFPRNGQKKNCWIKRSVKAAFLIALSFLITVQSGEAASPASSTAAVTYPVKTFQDGKARHYQYKTENGVIIKYFILKSSDGVIRAAFDACDVCWPEGKGYLQKGNFMVCRNCGKQFASGRVNEVQGGCNPAPLRRLVVGEQVIIKVRDILEEEKYFNFRKNKRG